MEERLIIQDVSILKVPEDRHMFPLEMWTPVKFEPSLWDDKVETIAYKEVQQEMIKLRQYRIEGGERFYLGMPKKVAEALGMNLERLEELEKENLDLLCSNNRLQESVYNIRLNLDRKIYKIDDIRKMGWLDRLKFLFKGKEFINED